MATKSVGIRELKVNPGKIMQQVQDTKQEVDVTRRGEVIATIVPARRRLSTEEIEAALLRHRELAREISKVWPKDVSLDDVIGDMRREL